MKLKIYKYIFQSGITYDEKELQSQRKKELEMNLYFAKQQSGFMNQNAKEIFQQEQYQLSKTDDLIKQDIDDQKQSIMKRLEMRKKASQSMSRTPSVPLLKSTISTDDYNKESKQPSTVKKPIGFYFLKNDKKNWRGKKKKNSFKKI